MLSDYYLCKPNQSVVKHLHKAPSKDSITLGLRTGEDRTNQT